MKENDIVVPGEKLASEEEYVHGVNTYVENDSIYASLLGRVAIKNGSIEVAPIAREIHEIDRGMAVIGSVTDYMKSVIFVKLDSIRTGNKEYIALKDGKIVLPRRRPDFRRDGPHGYGHREPREEEEKMCKVGDTIVATVAYNDKEAYTLDMRMPEAGVVHSNCESCGGEMKHVGQEMLECTACKHREHRKVSVYYGKPEGMRKLFA
jgi:exosome complex RNA-binding protein Csl4